MSTTAAEAKTISHDSPALRCPIVLVLDTSHSMWGKGLSDMKTSLNEFYNTFQGGDFPCNQVDIAAVSMGDNLGMLEEFTPFSNSRLPQLSIRPKGSTPIGGALELAMDRLERQKHAYATRGIKHATPHLILLSDGKNSSDDFSCVSNRIRHACRTGILFCQAVALGTSPDFLALKQIAGENVVAPLNGELPRAFADVGRKIKETYAAETNTASAEHSFTSPGARAPSVVIDVTPKFKQEESILLDGTNILFWDERRSGCTLQPLLAITQELARQNKRYRVFFDASTPHILRKKSHPEEAQRYKKLLEDQPDHFQQVPAGRKADDFLLFLADDDKKVIILSNDLFRDHAEKYPWIKETPGRFLKGHVSGDFVFLLGDALTLRCPFPANEFHPLHNDSHA